MAEIIQKDGTWTFDGLMVRIVPGGDKSVGVLRQKLGEVSVPLEAIAAVSFEPGRKAGRLRLRLRDGADPLLQITGGAPDGNGDPYRLTVGNDRAAVAEYFVDEVRNALLLDQVPATPVDRYLLPGPALPVSAAAGDGAATFDGERIQLSWNWKTEESKSSGGPREIALADVETVEWRPSMGMENGFLRFRVGKVAGQAPPKYDPYAIELWGFGKDPLMALVAAAVVARMPHPAAAPPPRAVESRSPAADDHDALLRRLRELGELHHTGVLTDEEFTAAKQAILRRL